MIKLETVYSDFLKEQLPGLIEGAVRVLIGILGIRMRSRCTVIWQGAYRVLLECV